MTKKQIERAKLIREEHRKACKMAAVSLVVVGAFIGLMFDHYLGFGVEAAGLYLVELV